MQAHRVLALVLVTGCASPPPRALPRPADLRPEPHPETSQPVDALLAALSTRQRVAQLVVPWLAGSYSALDDSLFQVAARWVDSLEVGGLIISVGSPFDIAAKLNALPRRSRLPLLVSADLEWGAGMRVIGGTTFPQIMAVGATGNPRDAYTIGEAAATEGRAVGIHVNFAPDADVNNNPLNPIINVRSFGEDPRAVARLVQEYVRGLQDHGMLATLKHFPGQGDTRQDSHISLPVNTADYPRLDSLELVPFRAGIAAGAGAVMSAHIAFPALTLVRDSGGAVRALRAERCHLALIAYADEMNGTVAVRIAEELRKAGDTVDYFRLWPMSGTLSYDSARATIARSRRAVIVANVRPLSWRGTIALPDSLARLIMATDATRPTVLVSLGSPYLLDQAPSAKSFLIAWSGVRAAERAVGLALLGQVPIAGHLPIRIPPSYPVGYGITVAD